MKNRVICILLFCIAVPSIVFPIEEYHDSINSENLIKLWISQSEKEEYLVKLYIQNLQEDTLWVRSSFFLDDISKLSYILTYRCVQITSDSTNCYWQTPLNETDPPHIEFADKKLSIPSKQIVYMEIPIRRDYIKYEIYFKVKFLLIYNNKVHVYKKESNRIYIEKYEEYDE